MDEQEIRKDERRRIAEICRLRADDQMWLLEDGNLLRSIARLAMTDADVDRCRGKISEALAIARILEGMK